MTDISAEAIDSLADKIDSLDLTVDEAQILQALLDRASADDDVTGFLGNHSATTSAKLAIGLGVTVSGTQIFADGFESGDLSRHK